MGLALHERSFFLPPDNKISGIALTKQLHKQVLGQRLEIHTTGYSSSPDSNLTQATIRA